MARRKRKSALTKEQEDDLLRSYYLIEAARNGTEVEVEGVTLDLNCELAPAEWQPISPPGVYGSIDALYGPEIIFPWTPSDWRQDFEAKGHAVEAPPGSRVYIWKVVSFPAPSPFDDLDHPANRERRIAYLAVGRPDGTHAFARRGVVYLRDGAVASRIEAFDWAGAYRGMLERMEEVFGVEDVEDAVDADHTAWPKMPDGMPKAYGMAFLALRDRHKDFDGHAMAAFGYMIARAEAEEQLLAAARRGRRAVEQVAKASSAKAAKDRAASEPIRARAAEIAALDRTISLNQCARRVAREFDKDERWVARTIKELFERRGERGEYRPKRTP